MNFKEKLVVNNNNKSMYCITAKREKRTTAEQTEEREVEAEEAEEEEEEERDEGASWSECE